MGIQVNCFVKDPELNRLGYTVTFDQEIQCYGVSFRDEPEVVYWMEESQLEAVPKPSWIKE